MTDTWPNVIRIQSVGNNVLTKVPLWNTTALSRGSVCVCVCKVTSIPIPPKLPPKRDKFHALAESGHLLLARHTPTRKGVRDEPYASRTRTRHVIVSRQFAPHFHPRAYQTERDSPAENSGPRPEFGAPFRPMRPPFRTHACLAPLPPLPEDTRATACD